MTGQGRAARCGRHWDGGSRLLTKAHRAGQNLAYHGGIEMIFDHRTYTIKPGRLARFLETYERLALPLQRKYLGEPYGFFVTHIGPLNRVVHLWPYEDLADRERRREAMEADPAWQAYRRAALEDDTLADMESQILKPVSFFVPR